MLSTPDLFNFSSLEKEHYDKKINSFVKDSNLIFLEQEIKNLKNLSQQEYQKNFFSLVEDLIPWRKGPYSFSSVHNFTDNFKIDSEWDSEKKWHRMESYLNLEDKTVLDIGCNNGYFLFQCLQKKVKLAYGIDPVYRYYLQYLFIKEILYPENQNLHFDLLGVEDLFLFKKKIDVVFCMGILYHHTDPISILKNVHRALKNNGEVIIDCQGIEGDGSYCLFVEKKYTNAKGFWFLPTLDALVAWVKRSGFREIKTIYNDFLSIEEQKKTIHNPFPSLKEGIRENLTVEGYPLPKRFYLRARK